MAALRGTPTHDPYHIREAISGGRAVLFIQDQVAAMAIVEVITFPKGKWLHLWLVGARGDVLLDTDGMYDTLDVYRRHCGCRGFQTSGARSGWLRRIPGCVVEGVSLRLTLS